MGWGRDGRPVRGSLKTRPGLNGRGQWVVDRTYVRHVLDPLDQHPLLFGRHRG